MSKQLTVSAAFSVFALAALALSANGPAGARIGATQTGAAIEAGAPALPETPAPPAWASFTR